MSPSHTPASGYWTSKSTVQIWYVVHVANYLRQDPASAGKLYKGPNFLMVVREVGGNGGVAMR